MTDLFLYSFHSEALYESIGLVTIKGEVDDCFPKTKGGISAKDIVHIIFVEQGGVEDYLLVLIVKETVLVETGHFLNLVHEIKIGNEQIN